MTNYYWLILLFNTMFYINNTLALNDTIDNGLFFVAEKTQQPIILYNAINSNNLINLDFIKLAKDYINNKTGITSNELNFISINTDSDNNQHLRFYKTYKNIRISKAEIIAHINNHGQVFAMNGYMAGISAEVQNIIDNKIKNYKINQEKLINIIVKDLSANVENIDLLSITKNIINKEPYLIWQININVFNMKYYYLISYSNNPVIINKKNLSYVGH